MDNIRIMKVMTLLAVIILLSVSPVHADTKAKRSEPINSVQDNRGTDSNPVVIKGALTTDVVIPQLTEEQVYAEKTKEADDHNLANATVWLAVLTGLLAVIAILQLWMFLRQLKLAEKAARDSEMAAKAAKESADLLPKIERAYVFVRVNFDAIQRSQTHHYDISFKVEFFNHGKTPAIIKRIRESTSFADMPPLGLIEHPNANKQLPEGLVIGADKSYTLDIRFNLTMEQWNELNNLSKRFYTVGLIDYIDVLGGTRNTGFCWQTVIQDEKPIPIICPSPLNKFN